MEVTVTRFTLIDQSGQSLGGSISWSQKAPGKLTATLFAGATHPFSGKELWSAYRYRRDGEGQRQLEKALISTALRMGYAVSAFARTEFSPRAPHLPLPLELS